MGHCATEFMSLLYIGREVLEMKLTDGRTEHNGASRKVRIAVVVLRAY
jgi:hypothetical protein